MAPAVDRITARIRTHRLNKHRTLPNGQTTASTMSAPVQQRGILVYTNYSNRFLCDKDPIILYGILKKELRWMLYAGPRYCYGGIRSPQNNSSS